MRIAGVVLGSIKCFCDRESCHDNLWCTGELCYIGLQRDQNGEAPRLRQFCDTGDAVLQMRGTHPMCEQRLEQWQEICRCTEDFCNTFAYLRSSIDTKMDSESGHGLGLGLADSAIDQPVIFTNPNLVGKPSPNVADERHELHHSHSHDQNNYVHGQGLEPSSRPQPSNLIVLLVIIPLSVGGFAVCLIFLNYHCKMC
ncbi:hypothetical protein WR25_03291 [Diploscapter pachys]|uniref:Uncharacterized protein n=1 Tax=Diploscapter pachys TaxID=2018661 RepID=A0A2A2JQL6_9BILA|nr:hypothetical protein WR25_03291 [Diploscapter pachys]